jgi:hypothetical protein
MSSTDRIGRVIFAVLVVMLWVMNIITGTLATTLLVAGAILVATSAMGFCPIYSIFGINTKRSAERAG